MKKTTCFLAISIIFLLQAKLHAQTWSELGGFNALAANGNFYCIYSDASGNIYACGAFSDDSGYYYVAKYNGTSWNELAGLNAPATIGHGAIYTICTDPSGNIYAAGDFLNDSGKCYVAKYNGTTWSELGGVNALAANSSINSICSDSMGNIYAAGTFSNGVTYDSGYHYVAEWNGTTWSETGGLNGLAANGSITSICLGASGNIYAVGAFTNDSVKPYLAKYNGSTWSNAGGPAGGGLGFNGDIGGLCTDRSGNIYYQAHVTDSAKACVAKYNGTTWSELMGTNWLFNRTLITVASDPSGNIYATGYFTNDSARYYVSKYDGTGWSELGGLDALAANNEIFSMCSDPSGNIYAAGYFTNDSGKYYVAKFSAPTGIKQIAAANSMNIFPNPTNNTFTISLDNMVSDATIKLLNITGQVVTEQTHEWGNKFTVNLLNQPPGIYFIQMQQEDNMWMGKVVKTN